MAPRRSLRESKKPEVYSSSTYTTTTSTRPRKTTTTTTKKTGTGVTKRAPATHHKRKPSIKDKVEGVALKVKGEITRKPAVKGAGTKKLHGTDGKKAKTKKAVI